MAESRARTLANLANTNALSVDSSSLDVGISSTSPDSDLNVGASIKMDGPSGIITATKFSGDGIFTYWCTAIIATNQYNCYWSCNSSEFCWRWSQHVTGFLNVGANIQLATAGVITATGVTTTGGLAIQSRLEM